MTALASRRKLTSVDKLASFLLDLDFRFYNHNFQPVLYDVISKKQLATKLDTYSAIKERASYIACSKIL